MIAVGSRSLNYSGSAGPERLRGLSGTEGFLEMFDGTPAIGRGFRRDEYQTGKDHVVILNNGFWQRAFGGRDVQNQTIVLNGEPYTIIGVMHDHWRFSANDLSLFIPRAFSADELQGRGAHYLAVFARLKPGASIESAQAEMTALASRMEQQYPDSNKGWGVTMASLLDVSVGDIRPLIVILIGAVSVVLLVACANLANMHLARATGRAREMAIRAAIGAGRWRIVQQLLTESLVLAFVGGGLGLLIAWWATRSFLAAYPDLLPRSDGISVDPAVLAFTAVLSIVTAALFGLAPAISASRVRFNDTLKDGARAGGSSARRWMRSTLVVAEVALALVLLAGAGLLLRSFVQLSQVNPGFEVENRLVAVVQLPQPKYADNARMVDFFDRAQAELRSVPGAQAVALTSIVPISGADEIYSIDFEGRPPTLPGQSPSSLYYVVSPEYFSTMGIPLLKGRAFTDSDRDGTTRVAVINDVFARMHYPNEDPIGKRIRIGRNASIVREIVGIVGSVKHYGLADKDQAQMYEPLRQMPSSRMWFVVKTDGDPDKIQAAVRDRIKQVDPDQPVSQTSTVQKIVVARGALPRVQAILMGALGAIALILAAVGLYGVMAYAVSQRTQEIGVRMALGAGRGRVLGMVLGHAVGLTVAGLAIGLIGAITLGQLLSTQLKPLLYKVKPVDVATLLGVSIVLSIVAMAAALIPARRATRVNPIEALRNN
jgi:putative ABC transport system permease protein